VTLGLRRCGAQVELSVSDTGVGIDPDDLPHVFERFYRADAARGRESGGTGLGLPIARWIVAQHGGTITIQSQPGQGTQVRVLLPLPADVPPARSEDLQGATLHATHPGD
jgi:signal transduction histidine kinase